MNGDSTPLQHLDDPIHDYVAATAPDEGAALGGWVLAFQTSYIEDNGPTIQPIVWAGNYAVSAGLSPFAAAGLADYVNRLIQRVHIDASITGDEGDDV